MAKILYVLFTKTSFILGGACSLQKQVIIFILVYKTFVDDLLFTDLPHHAIYLEGKKKRLLNRNLTLVSLHQSLGHKYCHNPPWAQAYENQTIHKLPVYTFTSWMFITS